VVAPDEPLFETVNLLIACAEEGESTH